MSRLPTPAAADPQGWREADLESVGACPACRSSGRALLYDGLQDRIVATPGAWSLWRCTSCRSVYLDPRPTAGSIGRAYGREYVTHEPPVDRTRANPLVRARRRLLNGYLNRRYGYGLSPAVDAGAWILPRLPYKAVRVDRWIRHLHPAPGRTRLLDFGCGNGEFLIQMRELGWSVQGLDFDPEAVSEATATGLSVRLGSLDALDPEVDRFDAITLGHVVEHLHDPLATLRRARKLLEPGGMIWMATPNIQALGHRLFRQSWFALDPPRHLVLFNSESLPQLVREAGFDRVEVLPPVPAARWLFPPSLAIARGRHPLKEDEPLSPGLRVRATVAELAAARRPQLAEELIVAGWAPGR